jgi:hypothetical protein
LVEQAFGTVTGAAVGHGEYLLLVEQRQMRFCPVSVSARTVPSTLIVNI